MNPDSNSIIIGELDPIQKRIGESETDSITARWEFGCVLVKYRESKQLPRGLRAAITKAHGLNTTEITRRMELADKFKTPEKLAHACTRWGGSWRRIVANELPKTPRKEKPDPSWGDSKKAALNRWLRETNGSDERRDELVNLFRDALHTLGGDES